MGDAFVISRSCYSSCAALCIVDFAEWRRNGYPGARVISGRPCAAGAWNGAGGGASRVWRVLWRNGLKCLRRLASSAQRGRKAARLPGAGCSARDNMLWRPSCDSAGAERCVDSDVRSLSALSPVTFSDTLGDGAGGVLWRCVYGGGLLSMEREWRTGGLCVLGLPSGSGCGAALRVRNGSGMAFPYACGMGHLWNGPAERRPSRFGGCHDNDMMI